MDKTAIDALVYSSIKNNLTVDQIKQVQGTFTKPVADANLTDSQYRDKILSQTTIKRACAMFHKKDASAPDKYVVSVRIPTPEGYVYDASSKFADTQKKFGYIDKLVAVPASMCDYLNPQYSYQSQTSDEFMALYCRNMYAFYLEEVNALGGKPSDDEFGSFYKPECACYIDKPPYVTGDSIGANCYAPGCSQSDGSYLDPNSRKQCSTTICTTNFNVSDIAAGGAVNINTKLSQACGTQIDQAKADAAAKAAAALSTPAPVSSSPSPAPVSSSPSPAPVSSSPSPAPVSSSPSPAPVSSSPSPAPVSSNSNGADPAPVNPSVATSPAPVTSTDTSGSSSTMMYVGIVFLIIFLLAVCAYFAFFRGGSKRRNNEE